MQQAKAKCSSLPILQTYGHGCLKALALASKVQALTLVLALRVEALVLWYP